MALQLGKISPSKDSISIPDNLSLSFSFEGNENQEYSFTYKLALRNNLHFELENGDPPVKSIIDFIEIVDRNTLINKELRITSLGPVENSRFQIEVIARNSLIGDYETCRISII